MTTRKQTVHVPRASLDARGASKADRRVWGHLDVAGGDTGGGTYRVLVEDPAGKTHEVARADLVPSKGRMGRLNVRVRADEFEPPRVADTADEDLGG